MVQQARISGPERGATRERILQVASALFASRGFDATPVRMIAERAGVTDPALYYYFPTKRDLHDALLVEPDLTDLPIPSEPLEAGVNKMIAVFLRYGDNPDLVRLALREQMSGEPTAICFRTKCEETFRRMTADFFEHHYREGGRVIQTAVFMLLSGTFWDAILRFGDQFEAVVTQQSFQRRLREMMLATLPEPGVGIR